MNDTHQELRDLITRVVTGDGAQLENLSMSDVEWELVLAQVKGTGNGDEHNFPITVTFEDWMEMVEVARNNTDGR